jgi:cyclic lactone autoinducer peptide
MKNKIFKVVSSVVMLLAVTVVSPTSWGFIEQPKTPEALK